MNLIDIYERRPHPHYHTLDPIRTAVLARPPLYKQSKTNAGQ